MIEVFGKRVVVVDIDHGITSTASGVIIPDDDATERGIKCRWAKVFAVGEEVNDIKVDEWVLLQHGRWSPYFKEYDENGKETKFWLVDYPTGVLAVCDERPDTFAYGKDR